jgi:hypothetical protein
MVPKLRVSDEKLYWLSAGTWFLLSLLAVLLSIKEGLLNNFIIYKSTFFHAREQLNLYQPYPLEYGDVFLYGPLFSIIIAPFAWMPTTIGAVIWTMANSLLLFYAIHQLPLPGRWRSIILLFSAHEMMINSAWLQTNALVAACIILGFTYVQKEKEAYALLFILAASFIKLYGIVGFAFFFFSKRPLRFVLWAFIWSIIFFLLPVLITSFSFLLQSYKDWYAALTIKNAKNVSFAAKDVLYQNISALGMIRRVFRLERMNDLFVLVPAFLLFISQYFPFRYWNDLRYRLYILCSVLLTVVLFSTGSETSAYIIAVPAMVIWFALQPKTKALSIAFGCLLVLTTFAYSDLLTPWLRTHLYRPYSFKAFPPFVLWIVILVQIHRRQFLNAVLPFDHKKNVVLASS